MHGGSAPQVRAAAAERELDRHVASVLGRLEVEPCENPLEALSQLAGEVLAWKTFIGELVADLTQVRYSGGAGTGEQIRGEIVLFERALDRCTKVLGLIARLDLDTRLARITEAQGELVVRAVDAALVDAGLAGEAVSRARRTAARHLRLVNGPPPEEDLG